MAAVQLDLFSLLEPVAPLPLMETPKPQERLVEVRPADPQTPPIVGEGIPPILGRVFIDRTWGRQPYYGYLYGWLEKVAKRYAVVALDGQDYRKGHFLIPETAVSLCGS